MAASPRVVSKAELEEAVWGDDIPSSDALRTHLHSVRQQVDKPFAHPMIITLPGVGYQVTASTHNDGAQWANLMRLSIIDLGLLLWLLK